MSLVCPRFYSFSIFLISYIIVRSTQYHNFRITVSSANTTTLILINLLKISVKSSKPLKKYQKQKIYCYIKNTNRTGDQKKRRELDDIFELLQLLDGKNSLTLLPYFVAQDINRIPKNFEEETCTAGILARVLALEEQVASVKNVSIKNSNDIAEFKKTSLRAVMDRLRVRGGNSYQQRRFARHSF